MNAIHQQLAAEAQRQLGNQAPSNVGTRPNPSASGAVAQQPIAPPIQGVPAAPRTPVQPPNPNPTIHPPAAQPMAPAPNNMTMAKPVMPTTGNPFGGAAQMMNGAVPTGGQHIEKALIKRMHMYQPI